ncbi:CAP domain-containing protein [Pedobacter sp. BS3]|uniref:CAP domain-containing protein n=1 Tax=Pedobacter sp. BS3 TaxID=2567937 RepID=UPI001F5B2A02|nr:CAP domain-containing protein [Pedobacter sp. BS3]
MKLLTALFWILYVPVYAQTWTSGELKAANTAANANYLSAEEKNIIFYMNLARLDGEKFFKTCFMEYVEANNEEMKQYSNYDELKIEKHTSYYKSLKKDLQQIKGLPMLYPDKALCQVAANQAGDLNRHNLTGHISSTGTTPAMRIGKIYPRKALAENCEFGNSKGLNIVCNLLLDKGVPSLGHRINILNTSYRFNFVGVSIARHPSYRFCSVIDFVALH